MQSNEEPHQTHMLVNCDMGGAYFSSDNGCNWQLLHYGHLQGNSICRPAFHPNYPLEDTVFAAAEFARLKVGRRLRSAQPEWEYADNKVFTPEGVQITFGDDRPFGEIAIDSVVPELMLVSTSQDFNFSGYALFDGSRCKGLAANGSISRIYRSADGGKTWRQAQAAEDLGFILAFHFDQRNNAEGIDTRRAYAAAQKGILFSDDGGQNWAPLDTDGLPIGEDSPLRSFTGGSRSAGPNGPELQLYASFENRGSGFGLYRRVNDGAWQPMATTGIAGPSPDAVPDNESQCQLTQFHHLVTSNHNPQLVHAFHANTEFNEPFHAGCYRWNNDGDRWEQIFTPFPDSTKFNVNLNWESVVPGNTPFEPGNGAATCPDDPERLVVVGTHSYLRDGLGQNWRCANSPLPNTAPNAASRWQPNGLSVTAVWDYVIDSLDRNRHYLAYTDCGLAHSSDAGETWTWGGGTRRFQNTVYQFLLEPGGLWGAFSSLHDIPNGNVILFHQQPRPGDPPHVGRVGFSDDHGATWNFLTECGLPDAPVTCLGRTTKGDLLAGFWERGVFQRDAVTEQWRSLNLEHPQAAGPQPRVWRMHVDALGTLRVLMTAKTRQTAQGIEFATEGVGLFEFDAAAGTWGQLGAGLAGAGDALHLRWPRDFCVHPDGTIYIAACEPKTLADGRDPEGFPIPPPSEGGAYRLNIDTNRWERLAAPEAQREYRYYGVYTHPTRPDWLYLTINEQPGRAERRHSGLWLSRNRGASFESFPQFPFKDIHKIVIDPFTPFDPADSFDAGTMVVLTNGAGVWRGPAIPEHEGKRE